MADTRMPAINERTPGAQLLATSVYGLASFIEREKLKLSGARATCSTLQRQLYGIALAVARREGIEGIEPTTSRQLAAVAREVGRLQLDRSLTPGARFAAASRLALTALKSMNDQFPVLASAGTMNYGAGPGVDPDRAYPKRKRCKRKGAQQ